MLIRNLQDVRSFVAVARCGSVKAAARQLNYDPSTVRSHVRELEHQLGVQLLRRGSADGHGFLTEAGTRLAVDAARVVDAVHELEVKGAALARRMATSQGNG